MSFSRSNYLFLSVFAVCSLTGCSAAIIAADAAVSVVATGVKVGAAVVETTVDVAAAGVKAATGSGEEKK